MPFVPRTRDGGGAVSCYRRRRLFLSAHGLTQSRIRPYMESPLHSSDAYRTLERVPIGLNQKRALDSLRDRIFCEKPVSTTRTRVYPSSGSSKCASRIKSDL